MNNNDTILSMIRVARSLDDAGLYHQSDRVYQSLIKIAPAVLWLKFSLKENLWNNPTKHSAVSAT